MTTSTQTQTAKALPSFAAKTYEASAKQIAMLKKLQRKELTGKFRVDAKKFTDQKYAYIGDNKSTMVKLLKNPETNDWVADVYTKSSQGKRFKQKCLVPTGSKLLQFSNAKFNLATQPKPQSNTQPIF